MNSKKAKRNDMIFELLRTLIAVGIAIGIVVIILYFMTDDPAAAIKAMLIGPFESKRKIANIFELAIPLTFCGLAIAVTFRSRQYNLVSDSAFLGGAMVACIVGIYMPGPAALVTIVALLAGTAVGGAAGAVPATMKLKLGASELVSSLMLNYIIVYIVRYILNSKVRDANSVSLQSLPIQKDVNLGKVVEGTRLHYGFFIAIACVVIVSLFIYKTKGGYQLRMTGSNADFASYSGMPVGKTIFGAQVFGASLAGLGGAVEMLGLYTSFKWVASPGYGFDGIIIATLARNNPIFVPFAAVFLAYIRTGAEILNRTTDVPSEIVSIIQATIIIFIASKAFLSNLKQKALVKQTIDSNAVKEA